MTDQTEERAAPASPMDNKEHLLYWLRRIHRRLQPDELNLFKMARDGVPYSDRIAAIRAAELPGDLQLELMALETAIDFVEEEYDA